LGYASETELQENSLSSFARVSQRRIYDKCE